MSFDGRDARAGSSRSDGPSPVGVVIATRDRGPEICAVLDRLVALEGPPDIVVVDNASTDATPELVAERHPGIALVRLRRNLGAAGRNVGVAELSTPYVAFCDDDSWWAPGSLSLAADLFERDPGLGLVAARVLVGEAGVPDPACERMARSPLPRRDDLPGPPVLGFIACGAVARREAFLEAGGFHLRFGIGGEEQLLAVDLAAAGWALCYVDEVVAHHMPSQVRDRIGRRAVVVRNALWTAWLRRRGRGVLERTARVVAGASDASVRAGLRQALAGLPWVARERRPVPRHLDDMLAALADNPLG